MLNVLDEPFDAISLRVNLAVLDWHASRLAREAGVSRNTVRVALKHPERLGLVAKYKIMLAVKLALAKGAAEGAGGEIEEPRAPATSSAAPPAKKAAP